MRSEDNAEAIGSLVTGNWGSSAMQRLSPLNIVLILTAILLAWSSFRHAPVTCELGHLPAGLYHWQSGHFGLYRVNPPLVRTLAALPVLLAMPIYDWRNCYLDPITRMELVVGTDFVRANGGRSRLLFFLGRLACIPFTLIGGYFCYRWARQLFGATAGLVACILWSSSPYVLGHGALLTPDVPAAATALVSIYCLWGWLRRPTWTSASAVGLMLGVAELCKFTLLVFYPLLPVLWLSYRLCELKRTGKRVRWLRQLAMLCVMVLISVYVINLGYLFEGSFQSIGDYHFKSRMLSGWASQPLGEQLIGNRFTGSCAARIPIPLPRDYVQGIDAQRADFESRMPSYLRGVWSNRGWWYYYLYALGIKQPLGTCCLVVLAVTITVVGVWRKKPSPPAVPPEGEASKLPSLPAPLPSCRKQQAGERMSYSASWRDEMIVLAPLFTIFIFVSSQTGFSIHSRYIIPALPFLFVWMSKVGRVFEICRSSNRLPMMAGLVVLPIAWSVCSSLAIYPNSLSYFNGLAAVLSTSADATYPHPTRNGESRTVMTVISDIIDAGPRNGPRHMVDSNIDWGQDLYYLEDWYASHPEARPIRVAYFGIYPLEENQNRVGRRSTGWARS